MLSNYIHEELSFMSKQWGKRKLKKQQTKTFSFKQQIFSQYFQKSDLQVKSDTCPYLLTAFSLKKMDNIEKHQKASIEKQQARTTPLAKAHDR